MHDRAQRKFAEALRKLRLEEARLRSASLAFSCGIGSQEELAEAAHQYGAAARHYKEIERFMGGATLTLDEAEVVR